nr:SDR family oxidoreductase [Novosphingobium sp. PASSN1]
MNGQPVAVVTGGASGIGAATCRRLAVSGARVVIVDVHREGANELALSLGDKHCAICADLGEPAEVEAALAEIVSKCGGIDILVNNAAALNLSMSDHAVADIDLAVWNRQLAVNLTAPMLLSRGAIPLMIERGGGAIVHVASATAFQSEDIRAGYAATKAALVSLSRSIAVQYGQRGVRSNVVAPGLVLSPAAIAHFPAGPLEVFRDHHMTPELGTPEDIAAVIAFLASDEARFVNGAVLMADGGFTAALPVVASLRRTGGVI